MTKTKSIIKTALALAVFLSVPLLGMAQANPNMGVAGLARESHSAVCEHSRNADIANCHARVIVDAQGHPKASGLPSGYGPLQFRRAYSLSGFANSNQTIAIVDAYDHPNILSDLNTYSSTFGIPGLASCPVSSGTASAPCFQKVDQRGGVNYPSTNAGWGLEIALDVEVAHAVCQNCNILLVEADSNSFANLLAAEDRAAVMGAKAISNSWGGNEFSGETAYDSHFIVNGVAITVSSGDSGYGTQYPAASRYVTAVGGTSLLLNADSSYKSESAWSGAGSGCSAFETKPGWQTDSLCLKRTITDVSAVADPNTGAAVYDSLRYQGKKGWFKVGGTSLSSPLVAAVYALAGNVNLATPANQLPYLSPAGLNDILSGSNGSCGGTYLCTALLGYDGPTGLGTPKGLSAF